MHTRTTFRQAVIGSIGPRLHRGGSWGQRVNRMIKQGLWQLQDAHTRRRDIGRRSLRAGTMAYGKPAAMQPCCSRLRSLETAHDLQASSNTGALICRGCAGRGRRQACQWTQRRAAGRLRTACSECGPGPKTRLRGVQTEGAGEGLGRAV